ncbi:peptidoglycan DD-metalloendopeptidase family protein [Patescibacteria group bacterium]|nr:peptidoglycan DD-metalloendopeptidase family protein [Patescibacteria group bacterium]
MKRSTSKFQISRLHIKLAVKFGTKNKIRPELFAMQVSNFARAVRRGLLVLSNDLRQFFIGLGKYLYKNLLSSFFKIESVKKTFAAVLYRQRGKQAKRFTHVGMAGLAAFGMMIAPLIAQEFPGRALDPWDIPSPSSVLSAATKDPYTQTLVSDKVRDRAIEYVVKEGDTVGSISEKFGVSIDTILWQNGLTSKDKIKPGETLEVLPVSGISHKVKKGDTIYSIAKKYDVDAQPIVNFPFNTFTNDETFELAIGQIIIVPDGIMPNVKPVAPRIKRITPDAGTVVASGQFVWPTGGNISQYFVWYHKAIDIANKTAPNIVAADAGKVIVAGWPDGYGYGNRVVIDHGNGYRTLYGHLSAIYVVAGQTVTRGSAIGKMGSTGRSTGTHLHFEVIRNGVYLNPLSVLQ